MIGGLVTQEENIKLELSREMSYDAVAGALASALGLADPLLLRFTQQNTYSQARPCQQPWRMPEAIADALSLVRAAWPNMRLRALGAAEHVAAGAPLQACMESLRLPHWQGFYQACSASLLSLRKLVRQRCVPQVHMDILGSPHSQRPANRAMRA